MNWIRKYGMMIGFGLLIFGECCLLGLQIGKQKAEIWSAIHQLEARQNAIERVINVRLKK